VRNRVFALGIVGFLALASCETKNAGGPTQAGGATGSGGQASGGSGGAGGGTVASGGTRSSGDAGAGGSATSSGGAGAGGSTTSGGGTTASGGATGTGGAAGGGAGGQAGNRTGGAGAGGQSSGGASSGGAASGGAGGQAGSRTGGAGTGGAATGGQAGGGAGGTTASGGGPGTGGQGGGTPGPSTFRNTYDGARESTVSLDTGWRFHLGDVSGAQGTTFDDSSWTAVDVPHDWSVGLAFNQNSPAGSGGGYLDGGLGWYRKTFSLPAAGSEQKLFVQFDGVYMDSTVWLNGTQVCARPYGYSSFECDITASAKLGASNVLAVKVNNQLPSSRWYSGSGIYRHVWLKTVSPVRVAYTGTRVTTPQISASSATVSIAVTVQNGAAASQSVTVASSVRDPAGAEVGKASSAATSVAAGKTADVTQTVTVSNPKLWSTSSPTLYSVVTTVSVGDAVVDTYTTPFGIRSFVFDANNGFSLNGTKMKLNGVCLHHDLGALGAATNYRAIEKRFQLLKEMGTNAIRTSHNPPAPEFLDAADRLGFLVMDEAFDMWYGSKTQNDYSRFFRTWADTDIIDMVARDFNHPSVIMWSIGNEIPQASDQNVVKQLMNAIKTKDTSRPIGQAFAQWAYDEGSAGLEDYVGLNYNPGLYDSQHAEHPTW